MNSPILYASNDYFFIETISTDRLTDLNELKGTLDIFAQYCDKKIMW